MLLSHRLILLSCIDFSILQILNSCLIFIYNNNIFIRKFKKYNKTLLNKNTHIDAVRMKTARDSTRQQSNKINLIKGIHNKENEKRIFLVG